MRRSFSFGLSMLNLMVLPAFAGDIVYTPVNPSFGGNAFNSAHLMGLATSQNQYKDQPKSSALSPLSNTDRFVQMLEARLYSGLAQQVSDAIFGASAQPRGTITFDDQQIYFSNNGTEIALEITDNTTGQITRIVVPTVVSTP